MTTDIKQNDNDTQDAWVALWLFVQSQIRWNSQDLDFEDFIYKGKELFEIKEKVKNEL